MSSPKNKSITWQGEPKVWCLAPQPTLKFYKTQDQEPVRS